jgi:ribonuclease P protein component
VLKRINRIGTKKEFEEVKEKGRTYQAPLLAMIILKKEDEEKRFGLVVSKRISKKAVIRNKIRREVYEAIRKQLEKISKGVRGIVLVRTAIVDKKAEEIEMEIGEIVKKL